MKNRARFSRMDGTATAADDPKRIIWYSVGFNPCGYWTDDFSRLVSIDGIPRCPHCSTVGFQGVFDEWVRDCERHESERGMAGYKDFVDWHKNKCARKSGLPSWRFRYRVWQSAPEELDMLRDNRDVVEDIVKSIETEEDV